MTKYLSFPGLGIDPFHISDTAFTVFGLDIKWYGIIITLGMVLAFLIARNRAKYEGITDDDIYDVTLFCVIFGIVGARLYYVLFKLEDFLRTDGTLWENVKDTFLAIVNIRSGGLAIYGGLIVGALTAFLVAKKKKIRFPILADVAAPAILVGQILGRWGNFFNIEAYGRETALPWRMGIHYTAGNAGEWVSETFVHPTFLYESLWNLIALVLIMAFYKKKKYNGQVIFFYMAWYGLGRFIIEGLRTDSLMLGSFRISQLVSAAIFLAGAVMFVLFMYKTPKIMRLASAASVSASPDVTAEPTDGAEPADTKSDTNTDDESETENGKAD